MATVMVATLMFLFCCCNCCDNDDCGCSYTQCTDDVSDCCHGNAAADDCCQSGADDVDDCCHGNDVMVVVIMTIY